MAGTYNNNQRKNDSVNTSGEQIYNGDGAFQSTFELNYWNKMINFRISPALDESKRTQNERFDYSKSISAAVKPASARLFAEQILQAVIDNFIAGTAMPASGIPVGLDNALVAGVISTDAGLIPHITIMKKIDPDTKVPGEMIRYQFQPMMYIQSYEVDGGSATLSVGHAVAAEIRDIQQIIIHASNELRAAGAHAQAFNDRFLRAKLFGKDEGGNGAPYSNTNNVFGGGSGGGYSSSKSNTEAPVDKTTLTNASSLSDFTDM